MNLLQTCFVKTSCKGILIVARRVIHLETVCFSLCVDSLSLFAFNIYGRKYFWLLKSSGRQTLNILFVNFVSAAESSEQIPLNPTKKKFQPNDDSAIDDAERRLLDVIVPVSVDCNRLRTNKTDPNGKAVSVVDSATSTLLDAEYPVTNLHDINAMSIASIYDREDDDVMDADK